jgi:hypothetical protein
MHFTCISAAHAGRAVHIHRSAEHLAEEAQGLIPSRLSENLADAAEVLSPVVMGPRHCRWQLLVVGLVPIDALLLLALQGLVVCLRGELSPAALNAKDVTAASLCSSTRR